MALASRWSMLRFREVEEETGVLVRLTGLGEIYTDPGHVMQYSDGEVRQEFSVCFQHPSQRHCPRGRIGDQGVRWVRLTGLPVVFAVVDARNAEPVSTAHASCGRGGGPLGQLAEGDERDVANDQAVQAWTCGGSPPGSKSHPYLGHPRSGALAWTSTIGPCRWCLTSGTATGRMPSGPLWLGRRFNGPRVRSRGGRRSAERVAAHGPLREEDLRCDDVERAGDDHRR
jgi:hypothetical protein